MLQLKDVLAVFVLLTAGAHCAAIDGSIYTSERIFGGSRANQGQFPHQVSIHLNISGVFEHNCGGAIITKRFVITAAHCALSKTQNATKQFQLVLGAHNITGDGEEYKLEKFFIHSEWNTRQFIHDIALIQTDRDIEFSRFIQPILVSRRFINSSYRAVTSGWGKNNDVEVTTLKYVHVYTMTNDECRHRWGNAKGLPVYDYSTICAYSIKVGSGVCSGDSGGPLMIRNELIGLTSWAISSCAGGVPDGFCRVSNYIDWIEEHINSTGTQPLPQTFEELKLISNY